MSDRITDDRLDRLITVTIGRDTKKALVELRERRACIDETIRWLGDTGVTLFKNAYGVCIADLYQQTGSESGATIFEAIKKLKERES